MEQRARDWIAANGGTILEAPAFKDDSGNWHWRIQCARGHRPWTPQVGHLAYTKSWCAECHGNAKLALADLEALAASRGGLLWEDEYVNSKTQMAWEYASGHLWFATANNVKNHGSWCPECLINVGEELVRATLVEAFPEQNFDRTRQVEWMEGLELDGYNANMRLAYEYQGIQHATQDPFFHRDEEAFQNQVARDARKRELCAANGVALLVIPHYVQYLNLRGYVRAKLVELGLNPAPGTADDNDFYNTVRLGSRQQTQLARLREVVAAKGGECLATQYLGYRAPVPIRCRKGHEFVASLEAIDQPAYRGPRFCPKCGGKQKKTEYEHRAIVELCGYVFIGSRRVADGKRSRAYLTVRCPSNHEYSVSWDNFKPLPENPGMPKRGCATCFNSRRGGNNRGSIVKWCERTGVEPLERYTNRTTKLSWRCASGHTFEGTLVGLKDRKRHPCPRCALGVIEETCGVTLISDWQNIGPTTPLVWECDGCGGRIERSLALIGRDGTQCDSCRA